MAEAFADKTEAPTLHRRAEARREGKLAFSGELSAAVVCLAATVLMQQTLPGIAGALRTLLIEGLSGRPTTPRHAGGVALRAIAPLAIGLCAVALAVHMFQTRGWIGWRKEHGALNIAEGTRRIFNGRSAFSLLLNLVKLIVIALILWTTLGSRMGSITRLQSQPAADLLARGMSVAFAIVYRICFVLIVLGIIDYAYQRRRLESELRMTRREVRDELRRQEGDPDIRRRRRSLWQAWKARDAK